jgi:hypothetical protein
MAHLGTSHSGGMGWNVGTLLELGFRDCSLISRKGTWAALGTPIARATCKLQHTALLQQHATVSTKEPARLIAVRQLHTCKKSCYNCIKCSTSGRPTALAAFRNSTYALSRFGPHACTTCSLFQHVQTARSNCTIQLLVDAHLLAPAVG